MISEKGVVQDRAVFYPLTHLLRTQRHANSFCPDVNLLEKNKQEENIAYHSVQFTLE